MRAATRILMTAIGLWPMMALPAPAADAPATPSALEARFRGEIRPFLETYCLRCHGKEKPKGEMDLSAFTSAGAAAKDLARWELVREQVEAETMPPPEAKRHPGDPERRAVLEWIGLVRRAEATRNAGDPGRVPARRLSNGEYDHTIRDLTSFDLRPTREFPVDPANEAGFDNSAESLSMSPALAKKYLEAARRVADHLVLTPDGLAFAPLPDARRDRSRQVLRPGDHRFLQAAEDGLRRLFPRGLAVSSSRRAGQARCHPR